MIFVDTHVHIHECFDLEHFLASVTNNFRIAAADYHALEPYVGVLCLTGDRGAETFRLLTESSVQRAGGWSFESCRERHSLTAKHERHGRLVLVAGRQIRCIEDLEVLALGTLRLFEDGQPIRETIREIRREGATVVLPWGFGKWIGRRGRTIRRILESHSPDSIHVGDNSGRPAFWPEPTEFARARRLGFRILPGSDPLPFPSEVSRAGSYGLCLPGDLDEITPAQHLLQALADPSGVSRPFGQLERPLRFVRNQLAMQIVKRQAKIPSARPCAH